MFRPNIPTRIEQARQLLRFRIQPSDSRALESIAVRASQREIPFSRFPAMLLRYDVINLERQRQCKLRKEAILATISGPLLIAALAVRLNRPLVTGNTDDFRCIQRTGVNLVIDNWREPLH